MPSRLASPQQQKTAFFKATKNTSCIYRILGCQIANFRLGSLNSSFSLCIDAFAVPSLFINTVWGWTKGMAFSTMIFCVQQPGFATHPHVFTIIKQL